jgi:hypothetical protein
VRKPNVKRPNIIASDVEKKFLYCLCVCVLCFAAEEWDVNQKIKETEICTMKKKNEWRLVM